MSDYRKELKMLGRMVSKSDQAAVVVLGDGGNVMAGNVGQCSPQDLVKVYLGLERLQINLNENMSKVLGEKKWQELLDKTRTSAVYQENSNEFSASKE